MNKITVHAKKIGFIGNHTGFIKVFSDGHYLYSVQTGIISENKDDAIHEAAWLSENFDLSHPYPHIRHA